MKRIFLISAFLFLSCLCVGQPTNSKINKEYQLSYEEYMEQYGIDDTCIAIIDVFFDKREYKGAGQMSFLPLSTVVVVINPPIGLGLMVISSPLFVSGLITYNRYSRKKLLKTLVNYQKTDVLSKRFKKKVTQLIQAQDEIYIEDLLEARYNLGK
jgi:hypothetical protein